MSSSCHFLELETNLIYEDLKCVINFVPILILPRTIVLHKGTASYLEYLFVFLEINKKGLVSPIKIHEIIGKFLFINNVNNQVK